jgi:hypothetical protein
VIICICIVFLYIDFSLGKYLQIYFYRIIYIKRYSKMVKAVKLRKGLDIKLKGQAAYSDIEVARGTMFALSPDDFPGIVPKVVVKEGDRVGNVDGVPVCALTDGKIRGLLQDGVPVTKGLKSGDIDPRGATVDHMTVSDKAASIGGGVLEAILSYAGDRL